MNVIIKTGLVAALGFAIAAPAFAIDTGIKGLTQNGRIKVGASVLYDLEDQGDKLGPSNWLIESKTTYRPNRTWTFVANFWLRGDLSTEATSFQSPNGGLADITNPDLSELPSVTFPNNTDFKLNNCKPGILCKETSDLQMLNDWEDVIRELSVKYRDPKGRYSLKFGKQQRGWGESDGLRLIDLLHAQDLRQRFAFRDSDEVRIPALMLSADFNLSKLGMAGPFEALGMHRPTLEFNFTPEVMHSQFLINNPTPTEKSSAGGSFGLPWPDTLDSPSGSGFVAFGFNTPEETARRLSFTDAEYSMRLKFNTLGGVGTINAFYGMQDLPVLKLRGLNLIIGPEPGNLFNDPTGANVVLPISASNTEAIVHGVGGYLDFLRSSAAGDGAVGNPLTAVTAALVGMGALPAGNTCFVDANCSVNADVELDYNYRQMVLGITFTRDLSDFMSFGVKNSSPSVRLEMSHEFDHPFNRSRVQPDARIDLAFGPAFEGAFETNTEPFGYDPAPGEGGSGALAVIPSRAITKSDITSTMIGFDFPFWVPGWDSQEKSIFTSFQLFDIYTHDADKGLMTQGPYAFDTVQDHQNYSTFLWSMPLDSQRLILEGLVVRDITNEGLMYRQRVDFNYFGDSWRPRLEWMHFSGNKESAPLGIFNNSDYIELSLTYQF
ncbi:MAG: hypothetical protein KBT51_03545 [Cycloclasticus sp.]|nr:hypothetical protein [Cycloclasticus sp.]